MATTAGKLATELGIKPEQVLQACRHAGVTVLGEQTPLDDREAARIQAVLRVPPQEWPVPGARSDAAPASAPRLTGPPMPPPMPSFLPPPPSSGRRRTTPVWAIVGLVFALVLLLIVAITAFGSPPAPVSTVDVEDLRGVPFGSATTVAPAAPPAPIVGLAVGECWNDPAVHDLTEASDTGDSVEVPCDQPHQAEVYAVLYRDEPQRAPYPGDEPLNTWAGDQCAIRFEGFVGRSLFESVLNSIHTAPLERSWLFGSRTIVCSVYALDGTLLTGSVAGSGR